jgi:hypothetical protein
MSPGFQIRARELLWNADEATRTLGELCARNGIQHAQGEQPGS